jgi:hypothetical protein
MLNKKDVSMWTRFIWPRRGTIDELLPIANVVKRLGISLLSKIVPVLN